MNRMWSVIAANIRNNFQSKALIIVFIGVALLCTVVIGLLTGLLMIAPILKAGAGVVDKVKLESGFGFVGYITSIILTGISYNIFFSVPLVREKKRGNIESLLVTRMSAKGIWIAKSLAFFIPSFIVGVMFSFGMMFFISFLYFNAQMGFLLNPWMTLSTFVTVPLMYLALSLLMYLVGLTGKTVNAGMIGSIFLPGVTILMVNVGARAINPSSWLFTLANCGIALILFIIIIIVLPSLTKERIVQSCKE